MIKSIVEIFMQGENDLDCSYAIIYKGEISVIVVLKDCECAIFDYSYLKEENFLYQCFWMEVIIMGKLLDLGNRYLKESDWKIFAVLKICLVSMGILIGIHVPQKGKKAAAIGCAAVFLSTYVPLMAKLLRMIVDKEQDE